MARRVKEGHSAKEEALACEWFLRSERWVCELLSNMMETFGSGWLRKIKWLSEFVTSLLRDMRSPGANITS